jgi:choice-of-anchor B domain-containing protein
MLGVFLGGRRVHDAKLLIGISALPALLAALSAFVLPALGSRAHAAPASLNCELLAHREDFSGSYASCWGYVDPTTGVEYAILAARTGTAIYNIADPRNPVLTGFIPGPDNLWREMKTYREYCYVGTEGGGGLQIISLANPEAPTLASIYTGAGLSSIHSVTVDTLNARLYANGANGGCRILSLANPLAPVQIGNYTAAYVHDSHVRDDTLYAACISVGRVRVLNVANPAAITQITGFSTERNATHNCWTTEDRQFLLATDETNGGRVTSWDISDLGSPIQVDGFTADPVADAHNVHIRDDLAYVAHYTEGVHIVDITDPTDMRQAGYYYTYTGGGLFVGCWGVFNYFPSGTIIASDIQSGMFLVDYWEDAGAAAGVVTSAGNGQPPPLAQVSLVDEARDLAVSGSGAYFADARPGTYTLRARAFGHDSATVSVVIAAGDTTPQDFVLTPLPSGSVSGTVFVQSTGLPADAVARIDATPLSDATDAAGAFAIAGVPAGAYRARVDEYLFQPESLDAFVTVGNDVPLSFVIKPVDIAYNFEDSSTAGWLVNVDGTDTATSGGRWVRGNPRGAYSWQGVPIQPEDDHTRDPLTKCWITGEGPLGGGPADAHDVDDGKTTLYSPVMNLSGLTAPLVSYWRWYSNDTDENPGEDAWRAQISSNGGATWVTVDSTRATTNAWTEVRFAVSSYVQPTANVRMRFIAEDTGGRSIVEAALDDFRVWGLEEVTGVPIGGEGDVVEGDPDDRRDAGAPDDAGDAAGTRASAEFRLYAATPNPIRATAGNRTEFAFELPEAAQVTLEIFSIDGRRAATVVSRALAPGAHRVSWNARDDDGRALASGVYVYRIRAGAHVASRKLLIID